MDGVFHHTNPKGIAISVSGLYKLKFIAVSFLCLYNQANNLHIQENYAQF
jgi:hypothetical protein